MSSDFETPWSIAPALAEAFVAGPWQFESMVERGKRVVGERRWLRFLVKRTLTEFAAGIRPREMRVVKFLEQDAGLARACDRGNVQTVGTPFFTPTMAPPPGAPSSWRVPEIVGRTELAAWLGLEHQDVDWFADTQTRNVHAGPGPLGHYHYRWIPKRSGGARLIESPKSRLKAIQRKLLDDLLVHIPVHDAAHGFRRGRSVQSYVAPHVGRALVLKMDLKDFFLSITCDRVTSIFLTAGYPEPVARAIAGLCTNQVPSHVWKEPNCPVIGQEFWFQRKRYHVPHLPQGAPTSPALANLAAYRLDCRLTGLANAIGASYTRYADDLVFSGDDPLMRSCRRIHIEVGAIAIEEGFALQTRKTRMMRQGARQQVAGVVVNARPNLARCRYDVLKATLHNCVKRGPQLENRSEHPDFRAHLAGRIAHVTSLNPDRGHRLRELFDQISW